MKVAKCCESKEPELLTFEQIKKKEGIYKWKDSINKNSRLISFGDGFVLVFSAGNMNLVIAREKFGNGDYTPTSETLCVGLKDAAGKWVE